MDSEFAWCETRGPRAVHVPSEHRPNEEPGKCLECPVQSTFLTLVMEYLCILRMSVNYSYSEVQKF